MTVVRILIWNVYESKTSLGEIREHIGPIEGIHWISNEPEERFGMIAFGDLPNLDKLRELIGKEPEVAEEFDAEFD